VKGDARDFVGRTVTVSGKTIDMATKVLKNGVPEVVNAVEDGALAVSAADCRPGSGRRGVVPARPAAGSRSRGYARHDLRHMPTPENPQFSAHSRRR
jgi:hypothetical protein